MAHARGEKGNILSKGGAVLTASKMNDKLVVGSIFRNVERKLVDVRDRADPNHARILRNGLDDLVRCVKEVGGDRDVIIEKNVIVILELFDVSRSGRKHGLEGDIEKAKSFTSVIGMGFDLSGINLTVV